MKFRKKKIVTYAESAQVKTDEALSALCSTIEKLKDANEDISAGHFVNVTKINELENQNRIFEITKAKNEKIINNFEKLLGIDIDGDNDVADVPTEDCDNERSESDE